MLDWLLISTWASGPVALPCAYTMRFYRGTPRLALTLLLTGGACASTAPARTPDKQPPTVAAAAVTVPARPGPTPVAPSGPPITSDEDAEHQRRELDALAEDDPSRPGRRQALLDYYVAAGQAALEHQQSDDAYQSFELALTLFEGAELQDEKRPAVVPNLLALAQSIDKTFGRRGAHPQVVTAMMVQLALRPDDQELRRRYGQLRDWLNNQSDGVRNLMRGRTGSLQDLLAAPPPTLVSDLEATYRVWPAAVVRDELMIIYRAEAANVFSGNKKSPKDFLQSLSASLRRKGVTNGPAYKVARAYLRASRPQDAVVAIKSLGRLTAEDAKLLEVLEATVGRPPSAADGGDRMLPAIKLAMSLAQNPEDAEASLQICRDVAARAPNLVAAHMCTGELAIALERKGLALRAFERARVLAPGERAVWEMVGRLYVDRLSDLVVDERTGDLDGALAQVEAFYQDMRRQFPDSPPNTGVAVALAEVGRGYYNAGRIVESVKYLERSISVEPNAVALEQLGILQLRRGESAQAAVTLDRARAVFMANQQAEMPVRVLFYARMGRLIAEAFEAQPDGQRAAAEAREKALRQFEQLIEGSRLPPARMAEAEVERGKLLYQSGDREQALEAFRRAGELTPGDEGGRGSGQIYVDILAYLVPRGEVDEVVATYHRALGRVRLPESMKVYCSLWVTDLLVRGGQPVDPMAAGVLAAMQGTKWHMDLARWSNGKLTDAELLQLADTAGRQAEANFYIGMARLRAGDKRQAEAQWRKVVDSHMLGYFEYEMASQYLRLGKAPVTPVAPLKAQPRPKLPPSSPAPPAGSI